MKKLFTLVELVIVVGICALFMTVAMPVLIGNESGVMTQCMSNLKEQYKVEQLYAADNDNYICPNTNGKKGIGRLLLQYAKGNVDIFYCPDAKDAPYVSRIQKGSWPEVPHGKVYIEKTYMRNSSIGGWYPYKHWHSKARKFGQGSNPAITVMTFDGNKAFGTWERIKFDCDTNKSEGAEYRHDSKANIIYQDGHLGQITPEDFEGGRGIGCPDAKRKDVYIFAEK